MTDLSSRSDELGDETNGNAIGLLQRRHTKPVESHHIYLNPEVQPSTTNEPRGENPWTGETAEEVREKAYSETMYQQMIHHHQPQGFSSVDDSNKKNNLQEPPEELEHNRELDEMMFDTAM